MTRHLAMLLCIIGQLAAIGGARAAESYDSCSGFITSVPATISSQGVWCLDRNVGTALSTGNAVLIQANNVTIDCNHFKIGGLAAGDGTSTIGIRAINRRNVTVRNCNIRGFRTAIRLTGGGALVEDNRLDHNTFAGIWVAGDGNRVQRNAVFETGGVPTGSWAVGITGQADVIDNVIDGVTATGTNRGAIGILTADGSGQVVRGNRVRGLVATGVALAIAIEPGTDDVVAGNRLVAVPATTGYGILGQGTSSTFCKDNSVTGFSLASVNSCQDAGGNIGY